MAFGLGCEPKPYSYSSTLFLLWTEAIVSTVAQPRPQWRRSRRGNVFVAMLVARAQQRLSVVVCDSAGVATMFADLVFWFAGFTITDLVCANTDGVVWIRESALCSEVQHQRRRRRDGGCRIVVAATKEGGGSDGGRERDERATRRWQEVQHREGSRSPSCGCSGRRWSEVVGDFGGRGCSGERERGKSCRFATRGSRRVREIETLNKPYGFGSSNNRSHIPLFGTGSCWTEAKHLTTTSLFQKCSPFLASGLVGSRPIALVGTGFARTEAYSCLWLRVLA